MLKNNIKISKFIKIKNRKILFTPGPGSLLEENILGLGPFFGRGDNDYKKIEKYVFNFLQKITGFKNIVTFQGSGSLAIEIALNNFIGGNILVIDTGHYSLRMLKILKFIKKKNSIIKKIKLVSWKEISRITGNYDWICASYVETSIGLKLPIDLLKILKKKTNSKLMLDATGSIGLEKKHDVADLITFSSCKGLFGLTGASFIAYKLRPRNKVNSFYLDLNTHVNKKITGPYHTISSLFYVFKNYENIKKSVTINKKKFFKNYSNLIYHPTHLQPLLCTYVKKKFSKRKNLILYKTRQKINGSVVCHLGETFLKQNSLGKIQSYLK